ncbi:hypothetical protein [Alteromonas gilva]|uniref:6,7-dimethyl-8-ribityllumazine synthase n=1 Tax=Alteromonas gilva TaxID=2987522 RepID=A0ABT5L1J3_9ALTE|nr:hypothetical protein [Alteromonas gilva]MDC8830914.1 hypothetical protein [Alteromonas gilva]
MNTSSVTTGSVARRPHQRSYTRPEPSVVTVGVIVFEWNDSIRKRIQKLGSVLGQAGIKLQLLTYTDIHQCDDKTQSLDGVVVQIVAAAGHVEKQRFDAILQHHQQQVFGSHAVIAAFSTDASGGGEVEAAIDLSMKAHSRRCEWLGLVDSEPEHRQFSQWCTGIAMRVRQSVKRNTVLAA